MRVTNSGKVAEVLAECRLRVPAEFEIPDSLFQEHMQQVETQQQHVDAAHRHAIAVARTVGQLSQWRASKGQDPPSQLVAQVTGLRRELRAFLLLLGGLLLALLAVTVAHGQTTPYVKADISRLGGTLLSGANVVDGANTAFRVNCVTGCTAGGSFTDNSAFTAGTTAVTNIGGVFNDGLAAVTSGNAAAPRITSDRMLYINVGKYAGSAPGAMANYGTSPGAVLAPGVNAFVTNIPHVIADSGSTTVVTGTVAVTQSTTPWTIQGSSASGAAKSGNPAQVGYVFNTTQPTVTTGQTVEAQGTARGAAIVATGADAFNVTVNAALPTGANVIGALSANQSVNVAQINGVAPLMGNGITGAGSQRVTIASDNTAFPVNATLSAETTKVIGTVRNLGNAGAAFDAANNAAMPANSLSVGLETNATAANPTVATAGNIRRGIADVNGSQFVRLDSPNYWSCGLKSLAATLTQCQAAPASGLRLYITDISVTTTTATAGTYAIQYGTGINCATGTTALYPNTATADRYTAPATTGTGVTMQTMSFHTPLVPAAANAVCVIGVATNTITIQLQGYTAP